jgi:hypothetical protein
MAADREGQSTSMLGECPVSTLAIAAAEHERDSWWMGHLGRARRRIGCSALAVLLTTAPGWAQQSASVEAEHARGQTLREQHRDQEAYEVYRGLYERTREPRALARMALAEAALSRWVDAEGHLTQALASSDPWIGQNRVALESNLGTVRAHLANLEVVGNVPGAHWALDGVGMGTLPMAGAVRVAAGSHLVDAQAEGYESARQPVLVAPSSSGLTRVSVTLVRSAGASSGGDRNVTSNEGREAAHPASPAVTAVASPAGRVASDVVASRGTGAGPWVVAGSGVALAVLGGVFWALREGAVGNCTVESDAIACPTAADASRAEGAAGMGLAANVSIGVGLAAIAGGALWLVLGRSGERGAATVSVSPVTAGATLSVSGRF